MTVPPSKKIPAFSIARAFGIFLVVLGHSEPLIDVLPGFWTFMYSFKMPLFFMMSGTLLSSKCVYGKMPFKEFWKKYCQPLLLPYLIISLAFAAIKLIIPGSVKRPVNIDTLILDLFYIPRNNPAMFLWFIYALIAIRTITFFTRKLPTLIILAAIGYLLAVRPEFSTLKFCVADILHYAPFFWIGIMISSYKSDFVARIKSKWVLIALTPTFIYVSYAYDFHRLPYFAKSMIGLCGALLTLSLASQFKRTPFPSAISILDRYSLEIYLLQFFFIFPISKALLTIGVNPFAVIFASFFSGIIGPIVTVNYIFPRARFIQKIFTGRIINPSTSSSA